MEESGRYRRQRTEYIRNLVLVPNTQINRSILDFKGGFRDSQYIKLYSISQEDFVHTAQLRQRRAAWKDSGVWWEFGLGINHVWHLALQNSSLLYSLTTASSIAGGTGCWFTGPTTPPSKTPPQKYGKVWIRMKRLIRANQWCNTFLINAY